MKPRKAYQKIEEALQQLSPGWWDRVVKAIPELFDLYRTPQPKEYHGEGDVAAHTRLAVEACPSIADPDLRWAALLHDIGKPLVTKDDGDRITAHGHAVVGADIADRILRRLQLPPDRRDKIVWVIRHHTFHLSWNLTTPQDASRRHRRFVADPRFELLLALLGVDSTASLNNPRGMRTYELYRQLREMVREELGSDSVPT